MAVFIHFCIVYRVTICSITLELTDWLEVSFTKLMEMYNLEIHKQAKKKRKKRKKKKAGQHREQDTGFSCCGSVKDLALPPRIAHLAPDK